MKKHSKAASQNQTAVQAAAGTTSEGKNQTVSAERRAAPEADARAYTLGLDLGDRYCAYCVLDRAGEIETEGRVATRRSALQEQLGRYRGCRIGLEVGTHSPWISRLLKGMGLAVIVANARKVKWITQSNQKNDKADARTLARLARVDPALLFPVQHRSEETQMELTVVRCRAALVEARTKLINAARGLAKVFGERLPACGADSFGVEEIAHLPVALATTLRPLVEAVMKLTEELKTYEQRIVTELAARHPEVQRLEQIKGVGPLVATTFVLTLGDKTGVEKSRNVGAVLGLLPKQRASAGSRPELSISKEGDGYMRTLLVQAAQYILSVKGPDTDLKRWGLKLAQRPSKAAKNKATVAVARKLAVVMHRLWVTGQDYVPLREAQRGTAAA